MARKAGVVWRCARIQARSMSRLSNSRPAAFDSPAGFDQSGPWIWNVATGTQNLTQRVTASTNVHRYHCAPSAANAERLSRSRSRFASSSVVLQTLFHGWREGIAIIHRNSIRKSKAECAAINPRASVGIAVSTNVLSGAGVSCSRLAGDSAMVADCGRRLCSLQLHRRGSSHALPPDAGVAPSLRLHREELERQGEALRTVWSWYLLPFAPGLLATMIAAALEHRINALWYICCIAFPLAFALLWELNRRAAARLARKIEELKAMEQPEG